MAYTPAERREKQESHTGSFSVKNKLQQYLRDNFGPDTINDGNEGQVVDMLMQVARDYDGKIGVRKTPGAYLQLAHDAIQLYKSNWTGKVQGQDNRGKRYGQYKT